MTRSKPYTVMAGRLLLLQLAEGHGPGCVSYSSVRWPPCFSPASIPFHLQPCGLLSSHLNQGRLSHSPIVQSVFCPADTPRVQPQYGVIASLLPAICRSPEFPCDLGFLALSVLTLEEHLRLWSLSSMSISAPTPVVGRADYPLCTARLELGNPDVGP